MLATNRIHAYFDPFKMWSQLHDELNDFWNETPLSLDVPLNLWTKENEAMVIAEVPGRGPEDVQVSVHHDVLTIEVNPVNEPLPEDCTCIREERPRQRVTRQIRLPFEIDPERIDATCDRGLLRINLSRHASTMPQKITVKAG